MNRRISDKFGAPGLPVDSSGVAVGRAVEPVRGPGYAAAAGGAVGASTNRSVRDRRFEPAAKTPTVDRPLLPERIADFSAAPILQRLRSALGQLMAALESRMTELHARWALPDAVPTICGKPLAGIPAVPDAAVVAEAIAAVAGAGQTDRVELAGLYALEAAGSTGVAVAGYHTAAWLQAVAADPACAAVADACRAASHRSEQAIAQQPPLTEEQLRHQMADALYALLPQGHADWEDVRKLWDAALRALAEPAEESAKERGKQLARCEGALGAVGNRLSKIALIVAKGANSNRSESADAALRRLSVLHALRLIDEAKRVKDGFALQVARVAMQSFEADLWMRREFPECATYISFKALGHHLESLCRLLLSGSHPDLVAAARDSCIDTESYLQWFIGGGWARVDTAEGHIWKFMGPARSNILDARMSGNVPVAALWEATLAANDAALAFLADHTGHQQLSQNPRWLSLYAIALHTSFAARACEDGNTDVAARQLFAVAVHQRLWSYLAEHPGVWQRPKKSHLGRETTDPVYWHLWSAANRSDLAVQRGRAEETATDFSASARAHLQCVDYLCATPGLPGDPAAMKADLLYESWTTAVHAWERAAWARVDNQLPLANDHEQTARARERLAHYLKSLPPSQREKGALKSDREATLLYGAALEYSHAADARERDQDVQASLYARSAAAQERLLALHLQSVPPEAVSVKIFGYLALRSSSLARAMERGITALEPLWQSMRAWEQCSGYLEAHPGLQCLTPQAARSLDRDWADLYNRAMDLGRDAIAHERRVIDPTK